MGVASNDAELIRFLNKATILSPRHPVVVSKFHENAPELEMHAVARDAVPAEVRETVEFRSACPASAIAMTRPSGARVAATA